MSIASSKDLDPKLPNTDANSKVNLTDSLLTQSSLLGRIQIADDTAWEQFVEIYAPLIFGWCRNKLDSHDDASDVTQDVFAKLAKSDSSLSAFREFDVSQLAMGGDQKYDPRLCSEKTESRGGAGGNPISTADRKLAAA